LRWLRISVKKPVNIIILKDINTNPAFPEREWENSLSVSGRAGVGSEVRYEKKAVDHRR